MNTEIIKTSQTDTKYPYLGIHKDDLDRPDPKIDVFPRS